MASRRIEERRAQHKRYKEDVEATGKPFFPHAMFHDTVTVSYTHLTLPTIYSV